MQIRTLTTYDVYNYGASLQAYALLTYLGKLGHDVKLINYQPTYLTRKYDYTWVNPESSFSRYTFTRSIYRVLKFLQRQTTMGRKRSFDKFKKLYLKETSEVYHNFEQLKNNPPHADLFVVGSDQIWNVFYETGRDPAFYLEFVKTGKKASYAASFSYLDISPEQGGRIAQSLRKFSNISVREYQSLTILEKLGIEGAEWVLDPIFLLSRDEWKQLMISIPSNEKYLLIYDFEKNENLKKFAKEYAKQNNLKIYSINDTYPLLYADRNFNSAGPIEFLNLIYGCEAFVSNSFHGTAFSILFHKPVFVFNRNRHKVNSRMESLMNLFELQDCILSTDEHIKKALKRTFDFNKTEIILNRELSKSKSYINSMVK